MKYVARVGLDYVTARGEARRVEPGEVAEGLPRKSIGWLREQGLIEEAEEVEDGV